LEYYHVDPYLEYASSKIWIGPMFLDSAILVQGK